MELPAPMLPTAGRLPTATGWAYELKWDGIRAVLGSEGGRLLVRSRHGTDLTEKFPELGPLAGILGPGGILDGEIVVFDGERPDWGATVGRLRATPRRAAALAEARPATLVAFDVLRLGRRNLRPRPYQERRALLEGLGLRAETWVVPPVSENGPSMMAASLVHGLEGVVAKKLNSPYVAGRSRLWVKERHTTVLDTAAVGWARRSSGGLTLLLAEEGPAGLVYVGRVTAPRVLVEALAPLAVRAPAVAVPGAGSGVQWVRPVLGVEVTAASRHPDGRLRHPKFVRARFDQLA